MNAPIQSRRSPEPSPTLTFSPLAWLKLQFFCHAGATEIGGFGISAARDLLYVEDFLTIRQQVSVVSVRFEDAAVAEYFDACVDRGLPPERFARLWIHTHPGASPLPSATDEETFARSFGGCAWALMFITGRTGQTYARLAFSAGPRAHLQLPVRVDWAAWPAALADNPAPLAALVEDWRREYAANIEPLTISSPKQSRNLAGQPSQVQELDWWDEEWWPAELVEITSPFEQEDTIYEFDF